MSAGVERPMRRALQVLRSPAHAAAVAGSPGPSPARIGRSWVSQSSRFARRTDTRRPITDLRPRRRSVLLSSGSFSLASCGVARRTMAPDQVDCDA